MTPALISDEVKARVLRAVVAAKYPREALPNIALHNNLTLDQVRDIVATYGGNDATKLTQAAQELADAHAVATAAKEPDQLLQVPVDRLSPDPDNIRDNLGDLTELAETLRQVGMLQPIVVRRRGEQLVVVMGHRRRAAALVAGLKTVPVIVSTIRPDDVLAAMLIENNQRQDLDPIEEARALAVLKAKEGLSDVELGQRIGRSQPYVSGRLALLDLSTADQDAIRAGTMAIGEGTRRGRRLVGSHRPTAWGKTAGHLTTDHPLATAVETLCRQLGHHKHAPGRIGKVGCGSCWEACIRSDERNQLERRRRVHAATTTEPEEAHA